MHSCVGNVKLTKRTYSFFKGAVARKLVTPISVLVTAETPSLGCNRKRASKQTRHEEHNRENVQRIKIQK